MNQNLLLHASARAEAWLRDRALPFWLDRGIDPFGMAWEEMSFDGAPRETGYRRTLVQFRQVYVFAHAAHVGWCPPHRGADLFFATCARARHRDGGFVHRLSPAGDILDATRDAYDQAFALLAAGWIFRLTGDTRALDAAHETLDFMQRDMAHPHGGFVEALPPRTPRRQNPHMHLFEALLVLFEVSGNVAFIDAARRIISLFATRFVTPGGALLEYFSDGWAPVETRGSLIVEPGHHFEWVWLLHEFERLTGEDQGQAIASLMDFGLKGVDAEGLAIDEMEAQGHWLVSSRKLWAQTEMLKALIVLAARGDKASEWRIPALLDAIFERFMVPGEAALWFEAIAADGEPLRARMPTTTLYHLMLSFMELRRFAAASRQ